METNLVGLYHLDKANLLQPAQNLHLVIGTRRKPTPQKPPKYLLRRINPKQHIYISSLFEWQEMAKNSPKQAFSFDYGSIAYVLMLDLTAGTGTISLLDKTARKGAAQANDC